jgi:hypothetical protein
MASHRRRAIRLTTLPARLQAKGYELPPNYRWLHHRAVSGGIPGAHQVNLIWHYFEGDEPAIAQALGLKHEEIAAA